MGNTCYLNSTMQVLYKIPELRQFLAQHTPSGLSSNNVRLLVGIKKLFEKIETAGESFAPHDFLKTFMAAFPQFSEREQGHDAFRQQDADECFQTLLSAVEPIMKRQEQAAERNLIRDLFEIDLRVTLKNTELNAEPVKKDENKIVDENEEHKIVDENAQKEEVTVGYETAKKLSCIIDNQHNPINNLMEGIKIGLQGSLEKQSDVLGRNAVFEKTSELMNLPPYLAVQKIRFVWRERDAGTNTEATKAKILRNVAFPRILDVKEFCTPELQEQIQPNRVKETEISERKKKESNEAYENYKKANQREDEDSYKLYRKFREEQKVRDDVEHDSRLWSELKEGNQTGNYELIGIITHKGRSTESGHYLAWVQYKGDTWLRFDDDEVTKVTIDEVMNLRGGGDWHMAYYLLYRRLDLQE